MQLNKHNDQFALKASDTKKVAGIRTGPKKDVAIIHVMAKHFVTSLDLLKEYILVLHELKSDYFGVLQI